MRCYRFTQTGVAHALRGEGNDDACLLVHCDDTALAFMADGMGSAGFGGEAARLCVDAGSRAACATFAPHELLSDESGAVAAKAAFLSAFNGLQKEAVLTNRPLAEFQTTFMAAVYDARTGVLRFGYCGDGGLFVCLKDGSFTVAVQPQKGENDNVTSGVLDCDSWSFGRIDNVAGFMMATDGLFERMSETSECGSVVATSEACWAYASAIASGQKGCFDGADELFSSVVARATPFSSVSDDRTVCAAASDEASRLTLCAVPLHFDCERPFSQNCRADKEEGWSEYVPLPFCRANAKSGKDPKDVFLSICAAAKKPKEKSVKRTSGKDRSCSALEVNVGTHGAGEERTPSWS